MISSKAHGVIDYFAAPNLMVIPRLLGWPKRISMLLAGVGVFHLLCSMLTKYELGLVPVLPYKGHLAIDGALAVGTMATPVLMAEQNSTVSKALVGIAVFEAVVTALCLVCKR